MQFEDKDEVQTCQYTLQVVAAGVFTCLFSKWRYTGLGESLKDILYEVLSFIVQVICLVFFPISIPMLFLLVRKVQRENLVRSQAYQKEVMEQRRMQQANVLEGVVETVNGK